MAEIGRTRPTSTTMQFPAIWMSEQLSGSVSGAGPRASAAESAASPTWERFWPLVDRWIPVPRSCIRTRRALRRQYPREEPYAAIPHVRICAGGDQRWSSLPQSRAPTQARSGWRPSGRLLVSHRAIQSNDDHALTAGRCPHATDFRKNESAAFHSEKPTCRSCE